MRSKDDVIGVEIERNTMSVAADVRSLSVFDARVQPRHLGCYNG